MKHCAFLSIEDLTGYITDDDLAIEPLGALGWTVTTLPWRQTQVPWDAFDLVVLRSTWGLPKRGR